MHRFRLLLNRKLVLAALVAVCAVALYIATVPKADAVIVAGPGVWAYYSNATYTTVVGARGTGCCGSVINWGITTSFKKFEKIYCLAIPCPN